MFVLIDLYRNCSGRRLLRNRSFRDITIRIEIKYSDKQELLFGSETRSFHVYPKLCSNSAQLIKSQNVEQKTVNFEIRIIRIVSFAY